VASRESAPVERVERPQDARNADVEVFHRARAVPALPVTGSPHQLRPAIAVVDALNDRRDCVAHAVVVPSVADERLERLGLVQRRH
jgi:hypothetical protein